MIPDKVRVLIALRAAIEHDVCIGHSFRFDPMDRVCSVHGLLRDCLELIEATPRVMTLEEVKSSKGRDVWLELAGNIAEDVMMATTITGCGTKGISTRYESLNYDTYGVKPYGWRCWTGRPTEERMQEAKWDEPTADR